MAKMFYTVEEAAAKLGTTPEKVREMVSNGQLQEFKDRDKLVFKREQVDLLSGGKDEDEMIPLADSGELSLAPEDAKAASGSGAAMGTAGGTKERSGISIFDADEADEADPSAQTQVTASVPGGTLGDPAASGSGLLNLTQEADDTSLGGNLLDDVYSGGSGSRPATGGGGGDGLFEPAGVASDVSGGGGMMVVAAEPYDGTWSGVAGGLALGMVAILAVLLYVSITVMVGGSASGVNAMVDSVGGLWALVGILAGLPVIFAVIGLVVGKKS
ncbi:MAG: helix-turn-helix domain-containing protein [Phycisphaerales bacterium]